MEVEDEYTRHWSLLNQTVKMIMLEPPRSYKPISYEQMYSAVYKCVCKHHSETLHTDLLTLVEGIVKNWSNSLEVHVVSNQRQGFINEFNSIMNQYFGALGSIVPIFTYLNRFYIESRLNTDLNTELLQLFTTHISDRYISQILDCLSNATQLGIDPGTVQKILTSLHKLNFQYTKLNTALFAKHLPLINMPMTEEDIESQKRLEKELQQKLRESGFDSGNQSRKRTMDDENGGRTS